MRSNNHIIILAAIAGVLVCGCRRVAPQAPSNRQKEDSSAVLAVLMNMRIAEEADRQCTQYVVKSEKNYVLDDAGFWYLREKATHTGEPVQQGETVTVIFSSSTLDGTLLEDNEIETEAGRRQSLPLFDHLLPLMHHGETVSTVVPYYNAYGTTGTEHVPPYTNCIIDIRVL